MCYLHIYFFKNKSYFIIEGVVIVVNKDSKKQKLLVIIIGILILVIIVMFGLGYIKYNDLDTKYNELSVEYNKIKNEYEKNKSELEGMKEKEKTEEKKESAFKPNLNNYIYNSSSGKSYGKVQVKGYATIKKVSSFDGSSVDYVFFNILSAGDKDFIKYVNSFDGNSYVRENAIGLGCLNDNILINYNSSDKLGNKTLKLTKDETEKILKSSKSEPIMLNLERLDLTQGSGATECYSHITYIDIDDNNWYKKFCLNLK